MIIGFSGNLGSGKTLSLTALATYFKIRNPGMELVSNYYIDVSDRVVDTPSQLYDVSETYSGVMAIDEIWAWADSRTAQQNDLMNELSLNSRKRGWVVMWTAQMPNMVDKRFREITDVQVFCEHHSSIEDDYVKLYMVKTATHQVAEITLPAEPFYGMYDTEEEVSVETKTVDYVDKAKIVREKEFDTKKDAVAWLTAMNESKGWNLSNRDVEKVVDLAMSKDVDMDELEA